MESSQMTFGDKYPKPQMENGVEVDPVSIHSDTVRPWVLESFNKNSLGYRKRFKYRREEGTEPSSTESPQSMLARVEAFWGLKVGKRKWCLALHHQLHSRDNIHKDSCDTYIRIMVS
jgi:hypothetical protein